MERVNVGNAELIQLGEGVRPIPGAAAYPEAGNALGERFPHLLDEDGAIIVSHTCYAVIADGLTVLVDTGLGPSRGGAMVDELARAGIEPPQVDVVINTHVHGDHTGGNLNEDVDPPVRRFENARYLFPRLDWEHYSAQDEPPPNLARDVRPLMDDGTLELFEGEYAISDSLTIIPTPGHTPGHSSLMVQSEGRHGYVLGDAMVTQVELEEPFWRNMFDWDSEIAGQTRLSLFERLMREEALAAIVHYPPPGFGRFETEAGKRVWRAI